MILILPTARERLTVLQLIGAGWVVSTRRWGGRNVNVATQSRV